MEISGQLLGPAGGVPGAEVIAIPVSQGSYLWEEKTVTRADGSFVLKIPQGTREVDVMVLPAAFPVELWRVAVEAHEETPLLLSVAESGGELVLGSGRLLDMVLHRRGASIPVQRLFWALRSAARLSQIPEVGPVFLNLHPGDYAVCEGYVLRADRCTFAYLSAREHEIIVPLPAPAASPNQSGEVRP